MRVGDFIEFIGEVATVKLERRLRRWGRVGGAAADVVEGVGISVTIMFVLLVAGGPVGVMLRSISISLSSSRGRGKEGAAGEGAS